MKEFKQGLFALLIFCGCSTTPTPKEKLYQFYTSAKATFRNDTAYIYLNNPVQSPLRYYISSSDSVLNRKLMKFKPLILQPNKDTTLKIVADSSLLNTLQYPSMLGDPNKKIVASNFSLPFPKGKTYKIIQGYNGRYSHNLDDYSRYSIDFGLSLDDTVCAADRGVVVGVIKDYKEGGGNKRWMPYSNFITLYHAHSGLFSQYYHLTNNGSLVSLGDTVKSGQPIGLSGETGYTDVPHLHFMVLAPVSSTDGLNSIQVTFQEGYVGEKLKRGDYVKK